MKSYRQIAPMWRQVSTIKDKDKSLPSVTAIDSVWNVVAYRTLYQAVLNMERNGWIKVDSSEGTLSSIVLVRENVTARLYARKSVV